MSAPQKSPAPLAPEWVRTFYAAMAVISAIAVTVAMIAGAPWRLILLLLPGVLGFGINAIGYRQMPAIHITTIASQNIPGRGWL